MKASFKTLLSIFTVAVAAHCQAATGLLQASGIHIVNDSNQPVQLKGFNLGALYPMESYMSPMSAGALGGPKSDTYQVMRTLQNRFGVARQRSLMQTYQDSWITPADLDTIKTAGFNAVRVPVWWGQFYDLDDTTHTGWRPDAFAQLDKLVEAAAARQIYVIIDMHGAVGGQSLAQSTGQIGQNRYWNDATARSQTDWMWWQIANHYKHQPFVAGYDLLNEPDPRPEKTTKWTSDARNQIISAYDRLYKAVRSADSHHLVFIEATFDKWSWAMLPDPASMGWRNVVYETHAYPWPAGAKPGETHVAQAARVVNHLISDFNAHKSWNVPGYVGEFNPLENTSGPWVQAIDAFNAAGLNWTMWSYKSSNSPAPNHWGWYVRTGWAGQPDIANDSAEDIGKKWSRWTTQEAFQRNVTLGIQP